MLDRLDDRPLADEAFDWRGIRADIRPTVAQVSDLCDAACDRFWDAEFRTACRRFLAAAAAGDPEVFRRRARTDTAAAVCWIVGKANEAFSQSGGGMRVKDLMAHFGIRQASISQRAATLLRAGGSPRTPGRASSWARPICSCPHDGAASSPAATTSGRGPHASDPAPGPPGRVGGRGGGRCARSPRRSGCAPGRP